MKKRGILCLLAAGALVFFLADAERIRVLLTQALALCAKTVIPSQFLFLVMSSLLVSLGAGELLAPRLEGLMGPLFHVDGAGAAALILGLVGGYPIGARTAADLYREGLVTQAEAERLLAFCNNANPAFLISVLGVGVFGSVRAGVWLWLIHVAAALLTGVLFRGRGKSRRVAKSPVSARAVPFSAAFVGAVQRALGSMLSICAFVCVFYVLAQPLRSIGGTAGAAAVGFLELFTAVPLLPNSRTGFFLAAVLAGWGGLSVLCQTVAAVSNCGLSPRNCLLGRAAQAALSGLLAALLAESVMG